MLLPEQMSRIVIAGSKSRLDEAIDALYALKLIHLIDHTTGSDEGFSIGTPRPYTGKASERLLSLKAAEKELGIDPEKDELDEPASVGGVLTEISSDRVESVVGEVFKVLDRKNAVVQKMTEETSRRDDLSKIAAIPVPLDMYKGYESIISLVGSVKKDPTEALAPIAGKELFVTGGGKKDDKRVIALFVKKGEKEDALRILTELEFSEISVPDGEGPAAEAIAASEAKINSMQIEIDGIEKELAALKEKHCNDILAFDEELSIEEMKGSTPLHIATSEYSFVVDAWVPTRGVDAVVSEMEKINGIYVELQENRSRSLHDVDHAEDRFKETPTKMTHGNYVKNFEYPVKLLSSPKYQEIDPTILLSIFFPLFFGFMVGDIGYAIPFIILGAYGLKTAKSKDFRAIATVLFFGGIWAFIFGFFLFGEMFGMHFIGHPPADSVIITWQSLLNLNYPDWFVSIFPDGHGMSKLDTVSTLLKVSVYVGIGHLMLGFIIGFINVRMQHGFKEALFEKGSWILVFVGLVMFAWVLTEGMIYDKEIMEGMLQLVLFAGAAMMVIGIIMAIKKEGGTAILEVPGLFGNILSYTRLAAIGVSKAGMGMAFNYIAIGLVGAGLGGIAGMLIGFLLFAVAHLMIWTLAIISAGLHSLRLHYVEMMTKFFSGDGKEYEPLEVKRKNTKIIKAEV